MNYNSNLKETSDERAELTKKFDKDTFQNTSNQFFARTQPTPLEDQKKLPISSFKNKLKASQALKAHNYKAVFIPGSNAATEFLTQPFNTAFESQTTGSIPFIPNTTATLVSVKPTSLEAQNEVPKSSLKSKLRLSHSSFNASSPLDNEKGSAPSDNKPSNHQ